MWAISGDGVSEPGGHVFAPIFKDWDNAVYTAAAAFAEGENPLLGMSSSVSTAITLA